MKYTEEIYNILQSKKIGHAYLFCGAEGYDAAMFFAKKLVEEKKDITCNPNIFSINSEDEIKISQIRELKGFMNLSAYSAKYKVAVIKDAEKMNKNASNALLKTLEEPSESGVLILTSLNPGSLSATILSRVQKMYFPEEKGIDNLEEKLYDLMKIIDSGISDKFSVIETIAKKEDLPTILEAWLSYFHDVLYAKTGCDERVKNDFLIKNINLAKDKYSQDDLLCILEKILETSNLIKTTNANTRLALENLVLIF